MRNEITTARAAALLGVSRQRIRTLIRSGQIVGARRIDAVRGTWWLIPTGPDGLPITRGWTRGRAGRPRKGEQR